MPPRVGSRYSHVQGFPWEGFVELTEREPFRFRDLDDNRTHAVVEGDTLFTLAGRYFQPLPRACGFWWVIADFQPQPIVDPTIELDVGRLLFIPSTRVLTDVVLADSPTRGVA